MTDEPFVNHEEKKEANSKRAGQVRNNQVCVNHQKKRSNHTFQEAKECQG